MRIQSTATALVGEKTRVITPSRVWLAMSIGDGEAAVERLCLLLVASVRQFARIR